jgi:hypothetical protein
MRGIRCEDFPPVRVGANGGVSVKVFGVLVMVWRGASRHTGLWVARSRWGNLSRGRTSMRGAAAAFNRSGFARFLNSPAGRIFRVVAGVGFLIVGIVAHSYLLGILALGWSIFPLSAGALDVCYISAALGGPISGKAIRGAYQGER